MWSRRTINNTIQIHFMRRTELKIEIDSFHIQSDCHGIGLFVPSLFAANLNNSGQLMSTEMLIHAV